MFLYCDLAMFIFAFAMILPTQVWLWVEQNRSPMVAEPLFKGLYTVAQNLFWIGLLAIVCFDCRKRNFGRSISYASGIVAGHALLILLILFGPMIGDYSQRTPFDSDRWKIAVNEQKPVRLRMVDDLRRRHKLEGMSRQDIEQLLGKPPQTNYFREYEYVYWLGPERGFISIDSEWLCIKFSKDIATEVRICRD